MEKLIELLAKCPKWARATIIALLAIALAVGTFFCVSSCSSVRTVATGYGDVTTTVRQSVADSTQVSISVKR